MVSKEIMEKNKRINRLEEQLSTQEKLASLGRLLAGLAHEIQNPLNFINNFSSLSVDLLTEYNNSDDQSEKEELVNQVMNNLQKINSHGKRADNIIRSILQYSRSGKSYRESTEINNLILEFLNFAYYGYKSLHTGVEVETVTHLSAGLPAVNIDQQELGRVFINLFNNSFDAIYQKAEINNNFSPAINVESTEQSGNIIIKIKDNGIGISEEIKEKVFEPFFTTKPSGSGTGLGLSISRDIILAHEGQIDINSKPGEYTEVIIQLPINKNTEK